MTWRKFSKGYREHETHQLVAEDGRILAEVTGSPREEDRGWWAVLELENRTKDGRLGRGISRWTLPNKRWKAS